MEISNETRKALKYLCNHVEKNRAQMFASSTTWTALNKAVAAFREDERRAQPTNKETRG